VGAKKKIGYGFSTLDILYIDDIFPEEKLKQKIRSGGRGRGLAAYIYTASPYGEKYRPALRGILRVSVLSGVYSGFQLGHITGSTS
jgi:hypothetical protein